MTRNLQRNLSIPRIQPEHEKTVKRIWNYIRGKQKASANKMNIGLDQYRLEVLLGEIIPQYSPNYELITAAAFYKDFVVAKKHQFSWWIEELDAIATILRTFVSTSPDLPPYIAAECHTVLAHIYEQLQQHNDAIQALMKALLIYKTHEGIPNVLIALTEHRLGLTYAEKNDYSKATASLQNALEIYKRSALNIKNLRLINKAQTALTYFQHLHSETTA